MTTPTAPTPTHEVAYVEQVLQHWPQRVQDVLLLGAPAPGWADALRSLGKVVTQQAWPSQNPDSPTHNDTAAGPWREWAVVQLPPTEAVFDAVLLSAYAGLQPIALLEALSGVLRAEGMVWLEGDCTPAQQDFWMQLAPRCGFDAQWVAAGGMCLTRMAQAPRWSVAHASAQQFEEIAVLFAEVFGHPMSRAFWDWKYGEGRGNAVLVRSEGKLVAHYGGMYRDVLRTGTPDRVAQIGDVMVQSQERGVLTRQGPFFLAGASWPEIYGPKGFGFPNARAMKVAVKMGLYAPAGKLVEMRWQPSAPRARWATKLHKLDAARQSDGALVDGLWASMARDLQEGVVGVRDWRYVQHRYFAHPNHQYEVIAVRSRWTHKPLGVLVLRRLEASCELVDVIGPLAHMPSLLDQATRLTGLWGLPYLYCWITQNYAPTFAACGGQEHVLDLLIPASCWKAPDNAALFRDRWWLMSGDTDFR